MPKFKALIMFMLVTALSFSLIGCSQLASRSTETEEVTGQDGELPEWLLLAHRSTDGPGGENDNGILKPKESDEDEDDMIADESTDQGTTQTASSPSSSGSTTGSTTAPREEQSNSNGSEPKPGTKEYLIEIVKRQQAKPEPSDDNDDDGASWFQTDDRESPSGWGN